MQGYKETKRVWDDLCGKVLAQYLRVIGLSRSFGYSLSKAVTSRDLTAVATTTTMAVTPLSSLRVSRHYIPRFDLTPNTSIQNHPLLIYHACFPQSTSASAIESHLQSLGVVVPHWRYTMYSTSHFHSTTHEVLCIAAGRANLCFGGEDNPGRVVTEIKKGDVVIIPAGVAHRLLEDLDGGFLMVGSYPKGKSWDMCYGGEDERNKIDRIKDMGWFTKDPIYGDEGPVLALS